MNHLKKNWKKWLAGISCLCLLLVLTGVIISHRIYLPGINFWWRFCSINDELTFYWYDEEAGECTGEKVIVTLRLTGFDATSTFLDNNKNFLNGEIHIEGFDLGSEGTFASRSLITCYLDIHKTNCYQMIHGQALKTANGKPEFGDNCVLYFLTDNPELVQLYLFHTLEDGSTIEYNGYCGNSPEEAKANRELMINLAKEKMEKNKK